MRRLELCGYEATAIPEKIGIGLTVEDFRRKIEKKEITGHVSLEQFIAIIADALAWKLDGVKAEPIEPITVKETVKSEGVEVKAGLVAGLRQTAKGYEEGREVIVLDFQAYVGAGNMTP